MWVRGDGSNISLCGAYNRGEKEGCKLGKHLAKAPPAMAKTKLFNKLKAERGKPNCPPSGPAPPDNVQATGG